MARPTAVLLPATAAPWRAARLALGTSRVQLATSLCFWLLVVAYTLIFSALALRRYDAFLMHALDMGNMEQAIWNTLHGHPFRFTNMRQHLRIEAFGTDTRLSFHVEPILLPLSLIALLQRGPAALLVLQTIVLASGAIPARRLVRRHLPASHLAEIVFPLAYLLFPAMQAANLYEFHPVTLTAALLLWALDFADERRVVPFTIAAIAALACKEEIGLVVALMALWSIRRGMPWRFALLFAVGATIWALVAVLVIVPAAEHAEHSAVSSSPYLTRYMDRNLTVPGKYQQVTVGDLIRYWAGHPDRLANVVLGPPKRGFVQRLLAPAGYLSLFSPLSLAISAPSFLLIMFSLDQHMYGGVAHYSAEFVGIVVAAAILGLARLAAFAQRRGLPKDRVVTAGCLVLLVLSLANARVNGFGPFTAGFEWPAITAHVRLGDQMLAMIPPNAPVSAQDTLDPHLSDRAGIYLFPDVKDAEYVALDVSASPIPLGPRDLASTVRSMLQSRRWGVLFANDGYLLLRRRAQLAPRVPVLPAAFYRFALPDQPRIDHPLRVSAGPELQMLGYSIARSETVNLRVPDVDLTTFWEITRPLKQPLAMTYYLTDVHGHPVDLFADQAALSWLPMKAWPVGRIVAVTSTSMGIGSTEPGAVSACLAVHAAGLPPRSTAGRAPLRIQSVTPHSGPFFLTAANRVLCVGRLPIIF